MCTPGVPDSLPASMPESTQAGTQVSVRVRGLCKSFGSHVALKDVSCTLPRGCITGIVGPDAAGKTTFLRLLAGLLRPDRGEIDIFGKSPEELVASEPNRLGYMPQKFGLYEDLTVLANLRLHARLRGLEKERGEEIFAKLLSFTGLAPFVERLAGRLSGGMKQKLGIACALLGQPDLLLLDEPGVGVDPLSRKELWTMVAELAGQGMTILWSTAYLDEAERCPHILMLDEGQILYEGEPGAFCARTSGRVYLLPQREGGRQGFLSFFEREGVEDVVVQGSSLRLVLAQDAPDSLRSEVRARGEAVSPRLEDSYMSVLGGINRTPSPYATGLCREEGDTPAIEAEHLTRMYGTFTAAGDISFTVRQGEIFGLLGPNGAGKSTTFRMLCGLLAPSGGKIRVCGVSLEEAKSEVRSRIGYVAQKFSLYEKLTVRQNLDYFGRSYGLWGRRLRERVTEAIELFRLTPYANERTDRLPLGAKRELAFSASSPSRRRFCTTPTFSSWTKRRRAPTSRRAAPSGGASSRSRASASRRS